jgi:hypothetical protein
MRWFAREAVGVEEAERDDFQMQRHAASAPRKRRRSAASGAAGSDWRPGNTHKIRATGSRKESSRACVVGKIRDAARSG